MKRMSVGKCLETLCYYTTDDNFPEMFEHIKNAKGHSIGHPELEDPGFKLSERNQVIWEMLVIAFGDCGTSPRTGWLEIENQAIIVKYLKDYSGSNQ